MYKGPQVLQIPSDIANILNNLELTIGQVAKLGGVTSRQVSYWTEKGVISARKEPGRAQYYGLSAVRKVQLVKELLDCGYTLATAAEEAEQIMSEEGLSGSEAVIAFPRAGGELPITRDGRQAEITGPAPQNLQERLEWLETRVQYLEALLRGVGSADARAEGISRIGQSGG